MKRINTALKKLYNKQVDGTGLAIFRIAYCIVLLYEVCQLFFFNHLIFDSIPYIKEAQIKFELPIIIWIISILFILFGALTRFFSIINYIMSLILIATMGSFEYHMFYAYMGMNLLLMILPVSKCLSIDRLLVKLKYSNTTFQYNPPKTVSQLYYFIPPFIGIGLVYFDSVWFKLGSPMWLNGLGSWLPSSLPMITHFNNSFLLNNEWLIRGMGWITIVFEAIFLFVFFRKKWRLGVFIMGTILHLGILLQFPIPCFALGVCAIYLLLVPISFWNKIFSKKNTQPSLFFYYDSECPLCVRTKLSISHFDFKRKITFKTVQFDAKQNEALSNIEYDVLLNDIYSVDIKGKVYSGIDTYIQVFKRIFYLVPVSYLLMLPGIYHLAKKIYNYVASNRTTQRCTEENCGYNPPQIPNDKTFKILKNITLSDLKFKFLIVLLTYITLTQVTLLYKTWIVAAAKQAVGFHNTKIDMIIRMAITTNSNFSREAMGITSHPVFTDYLHFNNYNHIVAVVYTNKNGEEKWLPIIDKNGQPSYYIYGPNWVNWTFRVNGTTVVMPLLNDGIERYTAFWAHKNNVDLAGAKFLIKVKKIESTSVWQKDFLKNQMAKPWIDGGYIEWKDRQFYPFVKNIESL